MSEDFRQGLARPLASTIAVTSAVVILPFFAIWLSIGPSLTGATYLAGAVLVWAGMLTAPWRRARFRGLVRVGLALILATGLVRLAFAGEGRAMKMERVGDANELLDVVNRIVPESDSALVGGRLILLLTRFIHDETGQFLPAMNEGYSLMADDEGLVPSPWAATYLGMQDSRSFDMQTFEPHPDKLVIFLHGYGGNFTLPCWEVAQATAAAGYSTYCPSTDRTGRWWMPDGVRTIRKTIELGERRGYDHIVLAGLSNGGIGLSRVAGQFRRDARGFIFISGVSRNAKTVRRPSLVVHGDRDSMTDTAIAASYAKRSFHAEYAEFSGGHFILVERRAQVGAAISEWLAGL